MLTYAYVGLCYVHYTHVSYPCQVKNEDRVKKERLLPIILLLLISILRYPDYICTCQLSVWLTSDFTDLL